MRAIAIAATRPTMNTDTAGLIPMRIQTNPKTSDAPNRAIAVAVVRMARPVVRTASGRSALPSAISTPSVAA